MHSSPRVFGITNSGQIVHQYTLTNSLGLTAAFLDYGARLQSLYIPDQNGLVEDVVLGYETLQEYELCTAYMGASIGRVANRIHNAHFYMDDKKYLLTANEGKNQLHGGINGLDKQIWQATQNAPNRIKFTTTLPDQQDGFPGTLEITLEVEWSDHCELILEFTATTDKKTPVNLTHHAYFNLSAGRHDCLGHLFQVNSSHYTPVDTANIPTGEIADVTGTGFDLRELKSLSTHLQKAGRLTLGYDHNWILKSPNILDGTILVKDPFSGRQLTFSTTSPGVQIYTGNYLNAITTKAPNQYKTFSGFCLEPQHYPDSVNQPTFPNIFLTPDETYTARTIYRFECGD